MSRRPLSFDLVCATVGRTEELKRFLASLERQTYRAFRVLLVDQNDDDRLAPLLASCSSLELVHLRSQSGLSRARNAALP
ncbi:MAG: glycosyltransferase family 2 protein, partial [Thermoleophilia bacterium]